MPEKKKVAAAIKLLLEVRKEMDPTHSVPTYDLHDDQGWPTGFCLVRADWLDEIWKQAYHEGTGDTPMLPHEHIDPTDYA